ncbi:LysR family transcriptional regulator [Streptomyces sp. NBC_01304]|uniref:LysR family transcriptional regulator n=1 Tax=Streptomyces sp. NBC_01304 TaxID=2903818 RepID=UPI002E0F962C|nr:LysR family transcriptional regulator [Streptomyces sp. NBC_01304]
MLERHEIEAFLTLADELHFGRTAERLHVSTARISQTIRKLERRVGVPLFDRTSRRVELTAVGRQLYEDVEPAWKLVGAGLRRAVEAGRGITGTLKVGFVGAAAGQLVLGIAELFQRRYAECRVEVREAQLADGLPWLREGQVEVLLTSFPVAGDDLVTGPALVTEARMVAVPAGHAFAGRESVGLDEVAGLDETAGTGEILEPGDASTFQELLGRVGAGRRVLVVGAQTRRYYPRPDVAYVLLSDAPPLEWGLAWPASGASARVRAFAEAGEELVGGRA